MSRPGAGLAPSQPIRATFSAGCASAASGAARRLPAVAARNARRFITCPHWPRLGGNGVGAASGSPITRSFAAPPLTLCPEGTAQLLQRLRPRLGDLRILLGGGAGYADGADDLPVVLLRFRLGAGEHLLGLFEADRGAVGDLWRRRRHRLLGPSGKRGGQQYGHSNQR